MKRKKVIFAAFFLTVILFTVTVSAASHAQLFSFEDSTHNNARWTTQNYTYTGTGFSMRCTYNPHPTNFYMTKTYGSYTTYTQEREIPANSTLTYGLLWNTGYTPSGSYYLLAIPSANYGSYSAYNCYGSLEH